jgi:hypothetical protein
MDNATDEYAWKEPFDDGNVETRVLRNAQGLELSWREAGGPWRGWPLNEQEVRPIRDSLGRELLRLAGIVQRAEDAQQRCRALERHLESDGEELEALRLRDAKARHRLAALENENAALRKKAHEADMLAAELIGALGLDREAVDRGGEPVGNAILTAIRQLGADLAYRDQLFTESEEDLLEGRRIDEEASWSHHD